MISDSVLLKYLLDNKILSDKKCMFLFLVECQPGEYPNASDTTQCVPCEIGFYKDQVGAMNCTQCQAGFSTVEPGSNDTLLCHGKFMF